jgi:WD40 repeat protein
LEQTAQFEGHTASVVVLAWSPDSELLASAGRDLVVRIWDVTTGRIITALEEYESWITSVIWSPDGSTLATTSFDLDYTAPVPSDNIRLWNPLSGRLQNAFHITLSDDNPTVPSFASWSPDGQSIAVITPSAPVHVFDIDAGTLAFDFPVGAASLIAWSPNGSMFATNSGPTLFHSNGGWSSTFTGQIWDGVTGELIVALQGHTDDVVALAWSPDSRLLATSSRDKTTRIWDVSTWETLATLENGLTEPTHYLPTDYAYTLSWSPDSARLGSVGTDNLLRIWDLSSVLSKAER